MHYFEDDECLNLAWPELVKLDLSESINMTGKALATGHFPKLQYLHLDDSGDKLVASHLRKAVVDAVKALSFLKTPAPFVFALRLAFCTAVFESGMS